MESRTALIVLHETPRRVACRAAPTAAVKGVEGSMAPPRGATGVAGTVIGGFDTEAPSAICIERRFACSPDWGYRRRPYERQ